jgi:SepF-like predicted cell division protein (DUF552 family)
MPFDIFKKLKPKEDDEEEYIELDVEPMEQRKKVSIIVEDLNNLLDADRIQRKLREGYIVLINIRDLKERDMETLKSAINRIKKTCVAIGGDIAGVSEDWVIATPSFATVIRKTVELEQEKISIEQL